MLDEGRKSGRVTIPMALGLIAAACSPPGASPDAPTQTPAQTSAASDGSTESARHPISGLEVAEVVVISGPNRHAFKAEMARSPADQSRGLMFRETLADDEAMLFPSDTPQTRSFWMKNTPISLDLIFVGADRRIANIETAVPYSLDSVRSEGAVIAVLEIRGGLSAELGIAPGDQVEWALD